MATTPRPFFARACEFHHTGTNDFLVDSSPVTVFNQGVWANSLSLAFSWTDYMDDYDSGVVWSFRMADSGLLEFYQDGDATINIDWQSSGLGLLLGFTGADDDFVNDTWTTADQLPWGVWFPQWQQIDQGAWKTMPQEMASGAVSQNGTWAGTTLGTTVYHRTMRFTAELAKNVLVSRREDDATMPAEEFFNGAMTAQPSSDDYPSAQGFWVYPDMNDAISDCTLSTTEPWNEATDIGVEFDRTSSPDTKVFCHTRPEFLPQWDSEAFFPRSDLRYGFQVMMNTAPVESWEYRDYSPGS